MSEEFKVEIINPEKSFISKDKVTEVVVPAYEGDIGILKDHIPLVTFLRPGFIESETEKERDKFFVEDGIVEFSNNYLLILSSTAINVKNLSKNQIEKKN